MRRLIIVAVVALLTVPAVTANAAPGSYDTLEPDAKPSLTEEVPVNVVFLGYEPDEVDESQFRAELANSYEPVVRSRLWYGNVEPLGISYTYDIDVTYADAGFEDAFFRHLRGIAQPADLTDFQQLYNEQNSNVLEVTDNHYIDAPNVERWLARYLPGGLGVDSSENTVVFVNWYGRDDFVHHVYTKTDEPDPDTGYNFGEERASRKLIAWGGTTPDDEETGLGQLARVWFYDLSAGPEAWTDNWNVDDPDLNGDDVEEYRMPPIWEYTNGGYRAPSALSGDLGKVARYVAFDLLMTTSPLYPPSITPPDLPDRVNVDSNTYEEYPGDIDASEAFVTPDLLVRELNEVQRTVGYTYDEQALKLQFSARTCYLYYLDGRSCVPRRPYPSGANLFVFHTLTRDWYLDYRPDYEATTFNYAVEDDIAPPFLGFADDNWNDGTQTIVVAAVSPGIVEAGYGLTTTLIHEVGHHVGLSHPHDGWDSETGVEFGPDGPYYFAWSGDESNSMMSYIDLNWDFSQFDRDNMSRFMTAAYLEQANAVLADILASDSSGAGSRLLDRADAAATAASVAFSRHRYAAAEGYGKAAYELVAAAARRAGVEIVGSDAHTEVLPRVGWNPRKAASEEAFVDRIGPGTHRSKP